MNEAHTQFMAHNNTYWTSSLENLEAILAPHVTNGMTTIDFHIPEDGYKFGLLRNSPAGWTVDLMKKLETLGYRVSLITKNYTRSVCVRASIPGVFGGDVVLDTFITDKNANCRLSAQKFTIAQGTLSTPPSNFDKPTTLSEARAQFMVDNAAYWTSKLENLEELLAPQTTKGITTIYFRIPHDGHKLGLTHHTPTGWTVDLMKKLETLGYQVRLITRPYIQATCVRASIQGVSAGDVLLDTFITDKAGKIRFSAQK